MIQISSHICCFVKIIMNKIIEASNEILNEYYDKIFLTMIYQNGYHPNYGNFRLLYTIVYYIYDSLVYTIQFTMVSLVYYIYDSLFYTL